MDEETPQHKKYSSDNFNNLSDKDKALFQEFSELWTLFTERIKTLYKEGKLSKEVLINFTNKIKIMTSADSETFFNMYGELLMAIAGTSIPIIPSPRGVLYSAFPPRNGEQLLAAYKGKRKKYKLEVD